MGGLLQADRLAVVLGLERDHRLLEGMGMVGGVKARHPLPVVIRLNVELIAVPLHRQSMTGRAMGAQWAIGEGPCCTCSGDLHFRGIVLTDRAA